MENFCHMKNFWKFKVSFFQRNGTYGRKYAYNGRADSWYRREYCSWFQCGEFIRLLKLFLEVNWFMSDLVVYCIWSLESLPSYSYAMVHSLWIFWFEVNLVWRSELDFIGSSIGEHIKGRLRSWKSKNGVQYDHDRP